MSLAHSKLWPVALEPLLHSGQTQAPEVCCSYLFWKRWRMAGAFKPVYCMPDLNTAAFGVSGQSRSPVLLPFAHIKKNKKVYRLPYE